MLLFFHAAAQIRYKMTIQPINPSSIFFLLQNFFFGIRPPLGLLPVLGPLEWYMTPTLDAALRLRVLIWVKHV